MTLTDHECHEVKNRGVCVGLLGQAVKRVVIAFQFITMHRAIYHREISPA
jgi:hypothetical protein